MKINVAQLSHIGMHRSENQDSMAFVNPETADLQQSHGCLLVVADGMGGAAGGRIASQIAASVVPEVYFQDTADPLESLRSAFQTANLKIFQRSVADISLRGMGTTVTALAMVGNRSLCAHVGDTRLYRLREHQMQQLTNDHSMVAQMVREGLLSEADARRHPQKNVLLRSMGIKDTVAVDFFSDEGRANDTYLLCTDGLHGMVEDEEIAALLDQEPPQRAADSLITLANQRGGFDNITVQIAHLEKVE